MEVTGPGDRLYVSGEGGGGIQDDSRFPAWAVWTGSALAAGEGWKEQACDLTCEL